MYKIQKKTALARKSGALASESRGYAEFNLRSALPRNLPSSPFRDLSATCSVLQGHHKITINRRVSFIILEDDERESEGRVFRVSAVRDSNF